MKLKSAISFGVCLILALTAIGYYLWSTASPIREGRPVFSPRDNRLNLKTYPKANHPDQEQIKKQKTTPKSPKADNGDEKRPLDISVCEDNPNAPDLLDRQLHRATAHEETPCAKIKLNLKF